MLNQRIAKSFCFRPLTDVLTGKSNAPPGGPHLGQNPHCTEVNASQNARELPGGMGGFGIDWYITQATLSENCSLLGTYNARGQIFSRQMGAIVYIKMSSVVILILILSLNVADQFARHIYRSGAWFHTRVTGHEDIF